MIKQTGEKAVYQGEFTKLKYKLRIVSATIPRWKVTSDSQLTVKTFTICPYKVSDTDGVTVTSRDDVSAPRRIRPCFLLFFTKCYLTHGSQWEEVALHFPQWIWGNQHRWMGKRVHVCFLFPWWTNSRERF